MGGRLKRGYGSLMGGDRSGDGGGDNGNRRGDGDLGRADGRE